MAGEIFLAGAIRGLIPEGERVVSIIERQAPDILALSISPEGLETMKGTGKYTADQAGPANTEEEIYMDGLSEFGEVLKPPPCFSMALEYAAGLRIPVRALDMDEEHFTAAYCKYVTGLDMLRQGNSRKRLSRHVFSAETPEEFVAEWDCLVNRFKGFRALEDARERWLAKRISGLSKGHSRVLAVIELERVDGVGCQLKKQGCVFEIIQ